MFPLAYTTVKEISTVASSSSSSASNPTVRTPFEEELFKETALLYDNDYKISLEYNTVAASTNATIASTPATLSSYFIDNGKELLSSTNEAHRLATKQQLYLAMNELKNLSYLVATTKYASQTGSHSSSGGKTGSSFNRLLTPSSASTSSSANPHLFDPVSVAARPVPYDGTVNATLQKINTLEDLGKSLLLIQQRMQSSIHASRTFIQNLRYLLDHRWVLLPSLPTNTLVYLSTPVLLRQYSQGQPQGNSGSSSNSDNNMEDTSIASTTINYPPLLAPVPHILCLPPHYLSAPLDSVPSSVSSSLSSSISSSPLGIPETKKDAHYYQQLVTILKKCYIPSIQLFAPLLSGDIAKRWLLSQKHQPQSFSSSSVEDNANKNNATNNSTTMGTAMAVAPPIGYTVSRMYMVLHQYSYQHGTDESMIHTSSSSSALSSSSIFESGYCTLSIRLDNYSSLSLTTSTTNPDDKNNVLLETCIDYTKSIMVQHSFLALMEQAKYITEHKSDLSHTNLPSSSAIAISDPVNMIEDDTTANTTATTTTTLSSVHTKKRQRSWDTDNSTSVSNPSSSSASWRINDIQLRSREIVIDIHAISPAISNSSTKKHTKYVLIIGIGTPIDIQKLENKYPSVVTIDNLLSTNLQRGNDYLQRTIQSRMMDGDGNELVQLLHTVLPSS